MCARGLPRVRPSETPALFRRQALGIEYHVAEFDLGAVAVAVLESHGADGAAAAHLRVPEHTAERLCARLESELPAPASGVAAVELEVVRQGVDVEREQREEHARHDGERRL